MKMNNLNIKIKILILVIVIIPLLIFSFWNNWKLAILGSLTAIVLIVLITYKGATDHETNNRP